MTNNNEWGIITILKKLQESGAEEPDITKLKFGLGWDGLSVELGRGLIHLQNKGLISFEELKQLLGGNDER